MKKAPKRPLKSLHRLTRLFFLSRHHYLKYKVKITDESFTCKPRVESARTIHNWARSVIDDWNVEVTVEGKISDSPTLFTPNHFGYADIMGFASVVDTQYVTKKELESWPLIGKTLKGMLLPFADRRQGAKSLVEVANQTAAALKDGASVCVFPEGTSTGGEDGVLPFKSSLYKSAIDAGCMVQPVALRWSVDDGGATVSEDIAYWKDHTFSPHILKFLGLKNVSLKLIFCDPIDATKYKRQELATMSWEAVSKAYANSV